jgi:hypothetical protein
MKMEKEWRRRDGRNRDGGRGREGRSGRKEEQHSESHISKNTVLTMSAV